MNSIARRNDTNEDVLSQKNYCAFTILSATKDSYEYAARNGEKENLMERLPYNFHALPNARDRSRYANAQMAGIQFVVYGQYTMVEGMGTRYNDCLTAWPLSPMRSPCIHMI